MIEESTGRWLSFMDDDSHGLKKDLFYGCIHEFAYNDIMNDLDAAGGRSGTGPDKTYRIEKHLCGLRPFFIICGGKTGGGQ